MTLIAPTVEVFFDLSELGGDFLTLDDPVKGQLDDTTYVLAGDIATDITAYCYDVAIKRGRSRELDEIEAGTCAVRLRNYDGRFLPADLNDPYLRDDSGNILTDELGEALTIDELPYGIDNIAPGKRVRVSVEGHPIFDGIIDDWSFEFDSQQRVDASFVAADGLASLARKSFDEWTATASQTAGVRLAAILDRPEVQYPANRALDAGDSTLQGDLVTWGSNALNYAQLVAKSELGRLFVDRSGVLTFRERLSLVNPGTAASFADDGTAIGFNGIEVSSSSVLLFNRVGVDREGGTLQTTENATSIAKYGVRQLSLSGLLVDSDAQSADMADFLSNVYSEPQTNIEALVVYVDSLSQAERAQVLSLDLADVVSVTWTPRGASSTTTQLSVVEGVSHQTGFDSLHVVSLALSPVLQTEVLILDDPALGLLDFGVLAY